MATLSYAMLTRPAPQSISPFYLARALPEGGGANGSGTGGLTLAVALYKTVHSLHHRNTNPGPWSRCVERRCA